MLRHFIFIVAALAAASGKARAEQVTAQADIAVEKDADAVVVELFTSQGCSSCPPAQAFLADLAARADVVALEFHVDYWDHLKTVFSGAWKDPFSSPVWTERQTDYNQRITESDSIFTPQMVIDGRLQGIGANRRLVNGLIGEAGAVKKKGFSIPAPRVAAGKVAATVDGPGLPHPAHVILARLLKESTTEITAGENKGDRQISRNIVREMMTIGTWDGGRQEYTAAVPVFQAGESCALLLQDPETMQVLAGAMCGL
jgi:hypothetical protein